MAYQRLSSNEIRMAMMSRPEFMQSLKAHPEVWSKISSQALPVKCTRNDQIEHGEEIPALFEHQGLFPFLSLPLEIRNLIYTYLLSTEYTREDKIERITVSQRGYKGYHYVSAHTYHFQTAILHCNHQINAEATALFHNTNLFVSISHNYCSTRVLESGKESDLFEDCYNDRGFPILARGKKARVFNGYAMEIFVGRPRIREPPGIWWNSQKPQDWKSRPKFMIASVDLLEFCKFFMFVTWMAASKHSGADTMVHLETAMLLVDILHATDQHSSAITYLRPAMRKLLEPLCYLHNIGLVIIDGPAPKLYLETVTQRIKRRAPSVQEMVQSMSSLIEQGDAAFLGGVFDVAALRYETALNQLHAGSHRREKFEMIIEGKYTGIIIGKVKAMLEYQLHLSLAKTNLQLQRYAMAHHWTIIVVHGRKAPDQEIAQMWYHRALASKGMGELHRAYQEMRKARLKRPDDVMIQAELAGLANHLALRRQDTVAV